MPTTHGFQLPQGQCNVKIERAMFDTKMAGILDGAGGAACHLCTATREQLKDKHIIQHGFPINRSIQLAREIFLEVDEDKFLATPPSNRFNITHKQFQRSISYQLLHNMDISEYFLG